MRAAHRAAKFAVACAARRIRGDSRAQRGGADRGGGYHRWRDLRWRVAV